MPDTLGGLLAVIGPPSSNSHTTRVEIAAISADLPSIHSGKQDHIIDLKPICITARDLKDLFYPDGDTFKIGEECSLSESLKDKLKFDNMMTCDPLCGEGPLNVTKAVINWAEQDLNTDAGCWDDCSRVNLNKKLAGIKSVLDLATHCREVDCSMTYNEYLDVLRRLKVSIVNHTTNKISPGNLTFDPDLVGNKIQAHEFNCEPLWYGCVDNLPAVEAITDPLALLLQTREAYNPNFSFQQITVGVVFKIPNPDAHDTVIRVNFNVNWASKQDTADFASTDDAGEFITYRALTASGGSHTFFEPYLPIVQNTVLTLDPEIGGSDGIDSRLAGAGDGVTFGGTVGTVDIELTDVNGPLTYIIVTVESTKGFFPGQKIGLYNPDGSEICSELKVSDRALTGGGGIETKGVLSPTQLVLVGVEQLPDLAPGAAEAGRTAPSPAHIAQPIKSGTVLRALRTVP